MFAGSWELSIVTGDSELHGAVYTLPTATKTMRIHFAHLGSLSMNLSKALEIGPMIAILSENKLPRYLFLYRPHGGFV
jgi:hypothetical protein